MTIRVFVFLAAAFVGVADAAEPFVIAENGAARAVISVPAGASAPVAAAAAELSSYLERMTGGTFETVTAAAAGTAAIRVGEPMSGLGPEELVRAVKDGSLTVTGEGARGTLYAVYRLLETLGCGFWSPDNETVPSRKDLSLPADFAVRDRPAFLFRQPYGNSATYGGKWRVKVGINGDMSAPVIPVEQGGHFQMDMSQGMMGLPNAADFQSYSNEWFAVRDGARVPDQVCTQSEALRAEVLRRVRALMAEEPDRRYISLSLPDNDQVCQCEKCAKLAADEGVTALPLSVANFVARSVSTEYPDLRILTLAYWITFNPPKTMTCEPNVGVVHALLDRNYALAPSACSGHDDNLRVWKTLTSGEVWTWGYNARFHAYPQPFPCIDLMGPELRGYRDLGVKGVFLQAAYGSLGDFEDLRCWLFAKLAWNPDADEWGLIDRWCDGACGAGAPQVKAWLREMKAIRERAGSFGCYGLEADYLTASDLFRALALFDAADTATKGDARTNDEVRKRRAGILITMLPRVNGDVGAYARENKIVFPTEAQLYREVEALGREFDMSWYGEKFDWNGFLRRAQPKAWGAEDRTGDARYGADLTCIESFPVRAEAEAWLAKRFRSDLPNGLLYLVR